MFKLRRADVEEQGTSWIELSALFQLLGGDGSAFRGGRKNNRSMPKESTKCALAFFKSGCRHVVSVCLPHHEQEFFKPSKLPHHRLRILGFSNFSPCISSLVILEQSFEIPLLRALLSLRMAMSTKKMRRMGSGGTLSETDEATSQGSSSLA